ncbi:MAG: DUF3332 family protein [Candidatus Deferrimicrobiaceae bacterium]
MASSAIIRKGGTAMQGSRFGKGIALVLAAAVGVFSAGCFGKFQLTRKLYDINQSIDEKYVRSAATWIFVIPYAVTGLLDLVIFNVIEFWTGENPVAGAKVTKVYAEGSGKTVLTLSRDGSATVAVIERYAGGTLVSTLRVRDDGRGGIAAVETAAGEKVREVSAAAAPDGTVSVTVATAAGTSTERYAASAVRAQVARAARIALEVTQASRGAAGAIPLAAATRVPAYGG